MIKKRPKMKKDRKYLEIYDMVDEYKNKPIYKEVTKNLNFMKETMGDSFDLITKELYLENKEATVKIGVSNIDGMADISLIYDSLLETLSEKFQRAKSEDLKEDKLLDYFKDKLLFLSQVDEASTFDQMFIALLYGDTIIYIEGVDKCLFVGTKGFKERTIEKPTTNTTVKGPKDAFTENIATNITLLRRRIRTPNLWVKKYIIGKSSNTLVAVVYIKGKADPKLIEEVDHRISEIRADSILGTSYVRYYLREKQKTVFPLLLDTERPDLATACLYEGRAIIIVDGTPFALIAPSNFLLSSNTPEDFFQKSIPSSIFRVLRILSFFVAIFLPSIYLSLVMYHSELLPLNLLFSISGQRQSVPIPAALEILLLLIAFDLLKEAGTRMPTTLGSSLSFIGAIVLGQSAVEAGLISAFVVLVVAISGICSLSVSDYDLNLTITVTRYMIYICTIFFGMTGITLSAAVLILHMISLRSFGLSYLIPYAPLNINGLKDSIIRMPLGEITDNDSSINENNPY